MPTTPTLWKGEQQASTVGTVNNRKSHIAELPDGGYFQVWGRDGTGVVGQRYDFLGNPVGGPTTIVPGGKAPSIATLTDGSIAIAYVDGNDDIVVARSNVAISSFTTIPIEVGATNARYEPEITALPNGGYAVTFNFDFSATDKDIGIRFVSAANVVGSFGVVANAGPSDEEHPEIATLSNEGVVVVWDHEAGGVQLRIFDSNGNGGSIILGPNGFFPARRGAPDGRFPGHLDYVGRFSRHSRRDL